VNPATLEKINYEQVSLNNLVLDMDILHLFPQVQKDDLPASKEGRPSKYQDE
jgi:hypothetical protein